MNRQQLPALLQQLERDPSVQLYLLAREVIELLDERDMHQAEKLKLTNEVERLKAAAAKPARMVQRRRKSLRELSATPALPADQVTP